jgi:hypothetical protein
VLVVAVAGKKFGRQGDVPSSIIIMATVSHLDARVNTGWVEKDGAHDIRGALAALEAPSEFLGVGLDLVRAHGLEFAA